MSAHQTWKASLHHFFAERATQIAGVPTIEDLCYISGREPRLWTQREIYEDLVASIYSLTASTPQSSVLEVGCAAGFIAKGLAPRIARYTGVDLARPALRVARLLQLPNAKFRCAEGGKLPFKDATFDNAYCYDVFTNFPHFDAGASIILDMLRVVRPGGKVLIGSIPDAACQSNFETQVKQYMAELDAKFGPLPVHPGSQTRPGLLQRIRRRFTNANPEIICYYFHAEDFLALGRRSGHAVQICDIHRQNPYFGYRFNVLFTR